jgi:hypothetical protein
MPVLLEWGPYFKKSGHREKSWARELSQEIVHSSAAGFRTPLSSSQGHQAFRDNPLPPSIYKRFIFLLLLLLFLLLLLLLLLHLAILEFELRALHLLGRCSIT